MDDTSVNDIFAARKVCNLENFLIGCLSECDFEFVSVEHYMEILIFGYENVRILMEIVYLASQNLPTLGSWRLSACANRPNRRLR